MTQTCSTCKWWGERPHFLDYQDGLRQLEGRFEQDLPRKTCGSPNIVDTSDASDSGKATLSLNAAAYSDCEGYSAAFHTGPDFGCCHWEAKQ